MDPNQHPTAYSRDQLLSMNVPENCDVTQAVLHTSLRLSQPTFNLLCHLGIAACKKTRRGKQAGRKKHKPADTTYNKLKIICFNVQSCRQKSTELNELVESNIDLMILTETWLYSHGDEAYIKAMTPVGYEAHSFPREGSRGGGIGFIPRASLSSCLSYKPLRYESFECVELKLVTKSASVIIVCLYRPPPSRSNKLLNSTFFQEFPQLLCTYTDSWSDISILGDFNFHYDNCSDTQVKKLMTRLSDHSLCQLVHVPTYRRGHILDWVIVRNGGNLLSLETVLDCVDLSDHYAIVCNLAIPKPVICSKSVSSRNIKAVCLADFSNDAKAAVVQTTTQSPDPDIVTLVDGYNTGLQRVLDHHAPSVTRQIRDRPSAPWMANEVREMRRQRRRAERQWRKTRLMIHRQIFTKERASVKSSVQAAKRQYYCEKIESSSSSKQLFLVSNDLLGKSSTTPLPSDVPSSELPQCFCDYFSDKVIRIREVLDSYPCDPPTFEVHEGPMLSHFEPVSEKEVQETVLQSPIKSCILDPISTSLTKQCIVNHQGYFSKYLSGTRIEQLQTQIFSQTEQ